MVMRTCLRVERELVVKKVEKLIGPDPGRDLDRTVPRHRRYPPCKEKCGAAESGIFGHLRWAAADFRDMRQSGSNNS